jgi:hypothetical protein
MKCQTVEPIDLPLSACLNFRTALPDCLPRDGWRTNYANGVEKCKRCIPEQLKREKGKGKFAPMLLFWVITAPWRRVGEWKYSSTHSLTSTLDGGERSVSRPGRFTPRERAPGTHWIGSWLGPRAVLDAVVKRKIPSLRRESNPTTPIVQPVVSRYTDWAIAAISLHN